MQVIKHFTEEDDQVFASVSIDTRNQFLMCSWRSLNATSKILELIQYCEQSTQTLGLKYALSDVSACQNRLQAGLQTELLEGFARAGLTKVALVNRVMNSPIKEWPNGVEVMLFKQIPLAVEWFFLPSLEDEAWDELEVIEF